MDRTWISTRHSAVDWWSKLTEGVFSSAMFFLMWILFAQVIGPIDLLYGSAGLLVFTLALLAAAMFSLQQALVVNHSDYKRAWFGITGGFLAWTAIVVSTRIGLTIPVPAGFIPLIMVSLIVFLLWRSHLPPGARFFSLTFLMNWSAYLLLDFQAGIAQYSPIFSLLYLITGTVAVLLMVLVLFWIIFQSQRHIQRAVGALMLWFLGIIILSVFHGPIY